MQHQLKRSRSAETLASRAECQPKNFSEFLSRKPDQGRKTVAKRTQYIE